MAEGELASLCMEFQPHLSLTGRLVGNALLGCQSLLATDGSGCTWSSYSCSVARAALHDAAILAKLLRHPVVTRMQWPSGLRGA